MGRQGQAEKAEAPKREELRARPLCDYSPPLSRYIGEVIIANKLGLVQGQKGET